MAQSAQIWRFGLKPFEKECHIWNQHLWASSLLVSGRFGLFRLVLAGFRLFCSFWVLVSTKSKHEYHEYCALFVELSVCIFFMKFYWFFPESFHCMQTKLELFSPEIVSAFENKELLSQRVYRKSATSAQTDGRTVIHSVNQLCSWNLK